MVCRGAGIQGRHPNVATGRLMRAPLVARLRSYWKMEAANVVVVPTVGIALVDSFGGTLNWLLVTTMFATSALLVLGTIALHALYLTVAGDAGALARVVPLLARCQIPAASLCVIAAVAAGVQHVQANAWTPAVVGGWVYAALATLEYVNYYHVQLQHFDHASDWARLRSGRGFRASALARALKRYRA